MIQMPLDESVMNFPSSTDAPDVIWVVSQSPDDDVPGRIGDARDLASRWPASVAVLRLDFIGETPDAKLEDWIHHGADEVHVLSLSAESQTGAVESALNLWREHPPRLVLSAADRMGRAWSARVSARTGWPLVSPALVVQVKGSRLVATRLDGAGRRAIPVELPEHQPAIVALRPGVAQPIPADGSRRGTIMRSQIVTAAPNRVIAIKHVSAQPCSADIRNLPKLIAGGKGVGSRAGFDQLRRVAAKLEAGVAASRMAVDLGWIEYDRQVGQTGKSVRPELYIACGISGASHHLEGMSDSRHIVAINTDAQAPLLKKAHLAIKADLHQVLEQLDHLLEQTT
jgi:electron transfer flavoprotein alpha subunit